MAGRLTAKSTYRIWLVIAAMAVVMLPAAAFGQGCALCYTQAAASGARMIQALRNGIVILIIPPVCICLGAIVLAYRRRHQFNQADTAFDAGSDW